MVGLITWLFPLAILGSIAAAARSRLSWPIGREHLALAIWGGWFATHWVVFSFAQGIFHEYYTTVMGPAVAALAGIGAIALWETSIRGGWRTLLLPSVILATAAWQATIVNPYPDWKIWLLPTLLGGAVLGSVGFVASRWLEARWSTVPWARLTAGVGLASLLVCPTLWSMTTVLAKGVSMMPTADPVLLGVKRDGPAAFLPFMPGGVGGSRGNPMEPEPAETRRLIAFLRANRHDETILVAAMSSMAVAPIIIDSGETAVGLGGFMGGDPAVGKEQFLKMVEDGRLRFFLFGPGPGGGGPPGGGPPGGPPRGPGGGPGFGGGPPGLMMANQEIIAWVREHGEVVDSKLWKVDEPAEEPEPEPPSGDEPPDPARMMGRMRRMTQLYDLRPGRALIAAPAD